MLRYDSGEHFVSWDVGKKERRRGGGEKVRLNFGLPEDGDSIRSSKIV
jgi:hypothetical protein